MKCYNHNETDAIGVCKACYKSICAECAVDTGRGLACSDECVAEVCDLNEIIDRSKQIYSIGKDSKLPPTGILMFGLFGVMFVAWGIHNSMRWENVDIFTILMGAGFLIIAIISYIRTRKLKINC